MKVNLALLLNISCGLIMTLCHCAADADRREPTTTEKSTSRSPHINHHKADHNKHHRWHPRGFSAEKRIVNGEKAVINAYPYQVALETKDGDFQCGGSIISNQWILTAAHCIPKETPPNLRVRAGTTYVETGGSVHSVLTAVKNPNYSMDTQDWDVAVIKVDPPFKIGKTRKAVKLVDSGAYTKAGEKVTVTGWGVMSEDSNAPSDRLMKVSVSVINQRMCKLMYALTTCITRRMICAGSTRGQDACQGDSGGPLVNESGTQIGIVSFGKGCAHWVHPGVYTNIADPQIREFIQKNTGV